MPEVPVHRCAPEPLPSSFFAREALEVALALLGKLLVCGEVVLRVSEAEAYRHPGDSASHCRAGRTARNAPMWGPPGHVYVYCCYGVHAMLNLVTDAEGAGAAVLIRGAEPVAGLAVIAARRGGKLTPLGLAGPGKVAQALGVDLSFSGRALTPDSGLYVAAAPEVHAFRAGPRVGIDYAQPAHRDAPWRVALAESRSVSAPHGLSPWRGSAESFLAAQAGWIADPGAPASALSQRRRRASPA